MGSNEKNSKFFGKMFNWSIILYREHRGRIYLFPLAKRILDSVTSRGRHLLKEFSTRDSPEFQTRIHAGNQSMVMGHGAGGTMQ